jgi:hypothetical protein
MLRKLAIILVLEILVGINAGLSFKLFELFPAALWAGSCFLALGLFILTYVYRWNFKSKAPLFWIALVHTVVFAVPMVVQRLMVPPTESISQVFGLPMFYFHKTSTWVYGLMFLATLFEIGREIARMRKKNPKI